MTETAYITLTNSNSSLSKRFRVIAEGYDDGTLEKSTSVSKTVGGGIDISQGATYTTWSPVIRVRWQEEDSNYGSLGDLQTFFGYNNPNGTPTDKITFVDNHGTSYTIVIINDMKKSLMGCRIEGTQAWYLVKLTFMKT